MIPLEQGSVFRPKISRMVRAEELSQSLWNRAVSSDELKSFVFLLKKQGLNPFGTGQCLPTI